MCADGGQHSLAGWVQHTKGVSTPLFVLLLLLARHAELEWCAGGLISLLVDWWLTETPHQHQPTAAQVKLPLTL